MYVCVVCVCVCVCVCVTASSAPMKAVVLRVMMMSRCTGPISEFSCEAVAQHTEWPALGMF